MQEYCPPGSARGARGNPRPYLDRAVDLAVDPGHTDLLHDELWPAHGLHSGV